MAVASETEVGVEADRDAGELGDALHADEHARHERRAVDRVVPDPEGLTGRAENDLLMSDRATIRTPWTRIPAGPSPPRAPG